MDLTRFNQQVLDIYPKELGKPENHGGLNEDIMGIWTTMKNTGTFSYNPAGRGLVSHK